MLITDPFYSSKACSASPGAAGAEAPVLDGPALVTSPTPLDSHHQQRPSRAPAIWLLRVRRRVGASSKPRRLALGQTTPSRKGDRI